MSDEEPSAIDPAPVETGSAAPCPPQVRAIGGLALLMGATLPAVAAFLLFRFPQERVLGFVSAGLSVFGALLLLLGGGAFVARARWGRIPLALFAWTAWPAAAGLTMAAATQVAEHGAPAGLYHLHAGAGLGAGLFGLVLGLCLLFGRVAAWGDGTTSPGRAGPSTLSTLALVSLITAFAPPWGLMHLVSLLLGTLAIGSIRRARGGQHGRGLAITGICISGGVFFLAFAGVNAAAFFLADRGTAEASAARRHLQELALLQRLHGELDWDRDGRSNPCTTTLTALLRAGPKDGSSGPLDPAEAEALRAADYGALGDRAVPLEGYVFRLEAESSGDEGAPRWSITACPWRDPRADILGVDERGEPWMCGGSLTEWQGRRR